MLLQAPLASALEPARLPLAMVARSLQSPGIKPWLLVQRDKSSAHECAVGRSSGDSLLSHSTQSAISCLIRPRLCRTKAGSSSGQHQSCLDQSSCSYPQGERFQVFRRATRWHCHRHLTVMLKSNAVWIIQIAPGCCKISTSIIGCPVLVQASCGNKTPPPSRSVAKGTATRTCH